MRRRHGGTCTILWMSDIKTTTLTSVVNRELAIAWRYDNEVPESAPYLLFGRVDKMFTP